MTHEHLKHQPSSLCTIPHTKLCSIHKNWSLLPAPEKIHFEILFIFGAFVKSRINLCSSNPNLQSIARNSQKNWQEFGAKFMQRVKKKKKKTPDFATSAAANRTLKLRTFLASVECCDGEPTCPLLVTLTLPRVTKGPRLWGWGHPSSSSLFGGQTWGRECGHLINSYATKKKEN